MLEAGRDSKDFGKVLYALLCLKWITNKDVLYSTWNSAQRYVPAWVGEEFGGECTEPMDYSLPSSSAYGILWARMVE